ncbi:nucleotidyl transferase AbiEii/AbiGii toxin family protein [Georgenia sp. TF02-10]|uniref:nucleotidyl transferase AbiEii/AbiGii toxin family protein n=1 Tax=Georgenia sp. TF02-10 TaxID=2917725 RepID=UPI001FA7A214|nr:nucleotidyl transferase AbiEii/AbiGii toxin family protein [Georgenia sp. TF02-10]UNX54629.1 nucleotidyl transferase AbiEii/AbiGii toxin family protein [Georgenia sp. TF02-10]
MTGSSPACSPTPAPPWVLKGRTAVLARVNDARHSKDVDLLSSLGDIDAALEVLRAAAAVDLADHFRFVIRTVRPSGGAAKQPDVAGYRVQVDAYCGTRRCEAFGVDLVTGSLMTTEPEVVRSSLPLEVPGLPPPTVRVYPVVDHIADKLAATQTVYTDGTRSSRPRDLVDLVVLARTQPVDGEKLHNAIVAERLHRRLPATETFTVPPAWATTYPPLAARTPHCDGLNDLGAAVRLVAASLEPAMSGAAAGQRWAPAEMRWSLWRPEGHIGRCGTSPHGHVR